MVAWITFFFHALLVRNLLPFIIIYSIQGKIKERTISEHTCRLCVLLWSPSRWPVLGLYCIPCHHHWQQKALMELKITLPSLQQEEKPHGGRFGEGQRKWLNYKHQPVGGGVDASLRLLRSQWLESKWEGTVTHRLNAVLDLQSCKSFTM